MIRWIRTLWPSTAKLTPKNRRAREVVMWPTLLLALKERGELDTKPKTEETQS